MRSGTQFHVRLMIFVLAASIACAADWPQFHGPRRDNKSDETGLLKEWPDGGPKRVWSATGIGRGYAGVSIANGFIYTTGEIDGTCTITALDLAGKIQWQVKNGPAWAKAYPGTRATPTIDNDRLYHESGNGRVACLDAKTGKELWAVDIMERFGGRQRQWGKAESVLIDGDRLICTPGGPQAGIAALNKNDGKTVWVCKELDAQPGFASPILVDYKGLRQIVTMMAKSIIGVHADTGKLLWQVDHVSPYDENTMMPIFHDGCVFISTRNTGARLLRLKVQGKECTAEEVWSSDAMDNQHGGVVLVDGTLYGDALARKAGGFWVCLEFKTGKVMWAEKGIRRCSLTYADGMLYLLSQRQVVALAKATPEACEIVSKFDLPEKSRTRSWAHPVVCGGRLYIRDSGTLYCYDVKGK